MSRLIVALYVLSIPFFDVPRIGIKGIALSFYLALFILVISLFKKVPVKRDFLFSILLFLIFLCLYSFSGVLNFTVVEFPEKSLNHILYYIISFFTYYVAIYLSVLLIGWKDFCRYIVYGFYLIAMIGVVELSFYFIYGYSAYANFLNHDQNVGTTMHLPRMRSTFNEPSHLAIYLLSILPILYNKFKHKLCYVFVLMSTLSSAAFFGIASSFLVLNLLKPIEFKKLKAVFSSFFIILFGLVGLYFMSDTQLIQKIVNVSQHDSTRYDAIIKSLDYISDSVFFGHGPSFYYNYFDFGLFNLYLQLYIESGLLGLTTFLLFVFYHFFRLDKNFVLVRTSILSIFFLYFAMDHYYIPGIWLVLSISLFHRSEKSIK
ncbi:hypothetical protein D5018_01590 [Parashewanella curva]|uniref:O-antigen ligase-related domain-containing protein n=1 Tax=Parashewanella curva TaxID=2338552 RepID=A0A3L8Q2W4_9GAMM|nr:O-antigen ligase family protein [Parashewanella curva]RLV61409.1 hypothetical protein D5018_01590 [Parashewanella curva]